MKIVNRSEVLPGNVTESNIFSHPPTLKFGATYDGSSSRLACSDGSKNIHRNVEPCRADGKMGHSMVVRLPSELGKKFAMLSPADIMTFQHSP